MWRNKIQYNKHVLWRWSFENIQICVDKTTDQAKSYTRIAALSDKGGKSCYDGTGGDGLNNAVHLLIMQYGGDTVIVAALIPLASLPIVLPINLRSISINPYTLCANGQTWQYAVIHPRTHRNTHSCAEIYYLYMNTLDTYIKFSYTHFFFFFVFVQEVRRVWWFELKWMCWRETG